MLNEKALISELQGMDSKKALVQIPEGLKPSAFGISELLEKNGIEALISVEPCFGACDLLDTEAKELGCDTLINIGHTCMGIETKVPVVFAEYILDFDPVNRLEENLDALAGFESICLVTTAQHLGSLGQAKGLLEKQGKKVFTGKSVQLQSGQIIGCDYSAARAVEDSIDCFLFIGSGRFHPVGLLQQTTKPVLFLNTESGRIRNISSERNRLDVKRQLRVEKARGLTNFAVFVSTKPGQRNMKMAEDVKASLEEKGKKAVLITASMLTPEKISGMGFQALVNTACPRIYDDQELFGIILLNPEDVKEL